MTIVEALSQLANRYSSARYAGLSAQGIKEGIDALNAGMMDLYRFLPDHHKSMQLPLAVESPRSVTISPVNESATLSTVGFQGKDAGRTVIASGDEIWHRVAGESALRDIWLGATGVTAATVYHDFVYGNDYPFDRLKTDPVILEGRTETRLRLINPNEQDRACQSIGTPRYYWLESCGVSQGDELVCAIRLLPLPDRAYRLRVHASYWPKRILFTDVPGNANLPIPDMAADDFIKLSAAHTIGLQGWSEVSATTVLEQAGTARGNVSQHPQSVGRPRNRVGTPRGY
ncbi:MAG: hypothetical protein ABW223_10085 [Rariglobus sp.]